MGDYEVARTFNTLFPVLDLTWLVVLSGLLFTTGRRVALVVALVAGVIYIAVDYGYFHLWLGTREVVGADPLLLLTWLSMSYGMTNFAWIWLMLSRDRHWLRWSLAILGAWLVIAVGSQLLGDGFDTIQIRRGTQGYHGGMIAILVVGYGALALRNWRAEALGVEKVSLLWLCAIGVAVQLGWESVLLVSGIRPTRFEPLIVDSLIETNLGMPYVYLIHRAVSRRFRDRGQRAPVFAER